jgi:uncharacterized membrane protein
VVILTGPIIGEKPVMKLLAVYIVFVLIGDVGSYLIGRTMEQFLSQSLSLTVFLTCFFLVFGLAWVLAVRVTKPHAS